MKLVTGGDFENAAVLAEKTAEKLLSDICNSSGLELQKRSSLPSCQARAFTLVNCFLLDDHRAAIWLEAMHEAVKLCAREPLEDACPICLQPIAWPAQLEVGTCVTVHGLKKATHRNGDQGVVGYIFYFLSTILLTLFILNLIIAIMATSYDEVISDAQLSYKVLYASLTVATVLLGLAYAFSFARVVHAASSIHAAVLSRVLRAPKDFFDTRLSE